MRVLAASLLALVLAAPAAATHVFVIQGRGWGHGVGMSQTGAEGLALHGSSYRQILGHYYQGTVLTRVRRVLVRVLLEDGASSVVVGSRAPFRVIDRLGRVWTTP